MGIGRATDADAINSSRRNRTGESWERAFGKNELTTEGTLVLADTEQAIRHAVRGESGRSGQVNPNLSWTHCCSGFRSAFPERYALFVKLEPVSGSLQFLLVVITKVQRLLLPLDGLLEVPALGIGRRQGFQRVRFLPAQ